MRLTMWRACAGVAPPPHTAYKVAHWSAAVGQSSPARSRTSAHQSAKVSDWARISLVCSVLPICVPCLSVTKRPGAKERPGSFYAAMRTTGSAKIGLTRMTSARTGISKRSIVAPKKARTFAVSSRDETCSVAVTSARSPRTHVSPRALNSSLSAFRIGLGRLHDGIDAADSVGKRLIADVVIFARHVPSSPFPSLWREGDLALA